MRFSKACVFAAAIMLPAAAAEAKPFKDMFANPPALSSSQRDFAEHLDYKQGKIELENIGAELTVPDGYYYLNQEDANRVLVDLWGNPPDDSVSGMLFPIGNLPNHPDASKAWGIAVSYEDSGHVSDEDAGSANYDDVLKQLQSDATEANAWRKENGYPYAMVMGWADDPFYDKQNRAMHWAEKIKFEGFEDLTLNYNLRILNRTGILVMSYIADMEHLPAAKASIPEAIKMVSFKEGYRYADYNSWWDWDADFGVAGMITAAAVAVPAIAVADGKAVSRGKAAAAGGAAILFKSLLLLAKKYWFLFLGGLSGIFGWFFKRR